MRRVLVIVSSAWARAASWLARLELDETQRFLLLSVIIGIGAGLLIVVFHALIDLISWLALGLPAGSRKWSALVGPAVGAIVSVYLVQRAFPAARGSGVVQTKAALFLTDGDIPAGAVAGKLTACSVSIGCGNALGPEDPSLHMGAGFATVLGRALQLPKHQLHLIAPVGAAAGIAAAFNTPITAVLFVIEEVLGAWNSATLGSIVLASVSAVVTSRAFLGDHPLFQVPDFEIRHGSELLVYVVMGLVAGLLASLFTSAIVGAKTKLVETLGNRLLYGRAAAAGLLAGIVGLWYPQVLGAGYSAVDGALHGQYAWAALLTIGLLKVVVTGACYSAGIPGGMFAPTLFIGAMLGGGLGALAAQFWPVPISSTSAFVLVGMGTFFAAVFRSPMTSIFMAFEVSASYKIILPVMIANMVAYLVARRLRPAPFFDLVASLEGMQLPSQEEIREQTHLRVEDVMAEYEPTEERIRWKPNLGWHDANGRLPFVYPDQPLESALYQFRGRPVLPVVSRRDKRQILGTIAVEDCLARYGLQVQPPGETNVKSHPGAG